MDWFIHQLYSIYPPYELNTTRRKYINDSWLQLMKELRKLAIFMVYFEFILMLIITILVEFNFDCTEFQGLKILLVQ